MQKIKFYPANDLADQLIAPPKPASQFLPQWYKEMPKFADGQNRHGIHLDGAVSPNTTLKHCPPFLDALTCGYIWSLPIDVEVIKKDGVFNFRWRTEGDFVTAHTDDQHPGLPAVFDGESFVMKWASNYKVSTPKGYSTMFTHPFNRHDLPFRTFTGIVDTDTFELAPQYPFQLISKDVGDGLIIPKGTPVVQLIPYKREDWKSERGKFDPDDFRKRWFDFSSTIVKSYKTNFWHNKKYI